MIDGVAQFEAWSLNKKEEEVPRYRLQKQVKGGNDEYGAQENPTECNPFTTGLVGQFSACPNIA